MLFSNLTKRIWVSEDKDAYLFDQHKQTYWVLYYLREGEEQKIACIDIWEVINTLYKLTNEQALFKCDLTTGIESGCC